MIDLKGVFDKFPPDEKAKLLQAFGTMRITGMLERLEMVARENLVSLARATPLDELSNLSQAVTTLTLVETFVREINEILEESTR